MLSSNPSYIESIALNKTFLFAILIAYHLSLFECPSLSCLAAKFCIAFIGNDQMKDLRRTSPKKHLKFQHFGDKESKNLVLFEGLILKLVIKQLIIRSKFDT